jgi:hypothetical protein
MLELLCHMHLLRQHQQRCRDSKRKVTNWNKSEEFREGCHLFTRCAYVVDSGEDGTLDRMRSPHTTKLLTSTLLPLQITYHLKLSCCLHLLVRQHQQRSWDLKRKVTTTGTKVKKCAREEKHKKYCHLFTRCSYVVGSEDGTLDGKRSPHTTVCAHAQKKNKRSRQLHPIFGGTETAGEDKGCGVPTLELQVIAE